jgi:methionine-S-sulfoxide reductase
MRTIWLAGGCFWGVEAFFQQIKGVTDTTVGYSQGITANPTYEQVCTGETGHAEACAVIYDETKLALTEILELLFRIIDPTTLNRQGNDIGSQYRSGIYYKDENDEPIIITFIRRSQSNYTKPIVVEVERLSAFFPAEEYHQDYLRKNPQGYCHINLGLVKPHERR